MKKLHSLAAACLAGLLLLAVSACTPAPKEISAEKLVADLTSPAFEGRISGSLGNQKAADYIADFFADQGLAPCFETYGQEYQGPVFRPDLVQPQLALIRPSGERIALQPGEDYLCSAPQSAVQQELVLSADPAFCQDGGGIYLAPDRVDAIQWLRENPGQTAAVLEDVRAGTSTNILSRNGSLLLLLDRDLPDLTAEGTALSIQLQPAASQGTVQNIAAVRRGSEGKNALIFGAHFDGSGMLGERLFPSALDNASGTATMMRIAALVQQKAPQLKNDLIFVAFNSEEVGMDGAKAFARAVCGQYETVHLINIDCVGLRGVPVLLSAEPRGQALWEALSALPFSDAIQPSTESYVSDQIQFSPYSNCSSVVFGGDMTIFLQQAHIHTPLDQPEQLDLAVIEELAAQLASFAAASGDQEFTSAVQMDAEAAWEKFWDAMRAQQAQITAEYDLAYNQGLCVTVYPPDAQGETSSAANYLLYGMRHYDSPAQLREQFPFLSVPESLGGFPFLRAAVRMDHSFAESALSVFDQNERPIDCVPGQLYEFAIDPNELRLLSAEYLAPDGSSILMVLSKGRDFFSSPPIAQGEQLDPRLQGWELLGYQDTYTAAKYRQGEDVLLLRFQQAPGEQSTDLTLLPMGENAYLSREQTISLLTQIDLDGLIQQCMGADTP